MIDIDPWHPEDEEYLPFQKDGIQELFLRPHILLADEMGLGKTIQVIGYINLAKPDNVLIVCPNNLRLNWLAEIDKWMDPVVREKYEVEQCTTSLFLPSNFVVASYEGFTKWHKVLIPSKPWNLFVGDEAHYIKNPSTLRSKAVFAMQEVSDCKRMLLTGTPICNYPYEIFPLIHFLDPKQWPSVSAFQRRYCPYGNKYGYHLPELQKFLRDGTMFKSVKLVRRTVLARVAGATTTLYSCESCSQIFHDAASAENHAQENNHEIYVSRTGYERIVPQQQPEQYEETLEQGVGLMIRRLKKEVLPELPKKRRQIIDLPAEGELLKLVEEENAMWKGAADIIQQIEMALGTWKEAKDDDDFDKMIESLRFSRQYFFDEIAIIRHKLALAKVPHVIDHVEDLLENKEKVVLFVHHNDVGRAIYEHFKARAVIVHGPTPMEDRDTRIKKFWNDDSCNLFIGSLKVSGVGLNLQVAANIVFAELDWVPGVITQAEDRCHRIGQDKSLLVQHLVAQNSMDSNMAKRIVAKQKSIQKALNRPKGEED